MYDENLLLNVNTPVLMAAYTTVKAGWFELKFAKIFGRKFKTNDNNKVITMCQYRDKCYFIDSKNNEKEN